MAAEIEIKGSAFVTTAHRSFSVNGGQVQATIEMGHGRLLLAEDPIPLYQDRRGRWVARCPSFHLFVFADDKRTAERKLKEEVLNRLRGLHRRYRSEKSLFVELKRRGWEISLNFDLGYHEFVPGVMGRALDRACAR